jgi:hypothetical protein
MREDAAQQEYSLRELFNDLRYVSRYGIAWRAMPNVMKKSTAIKATNDPGLSFNLPDRPGSDHSPERGPSRNSLLLSNPGIPVAVC